MDGLPSPDNRSSVAVYVNTVGDRGVLNLTLQIDGEPIEQKFVFRKVMRGGREMGR